jgi:predicted MFS family arabinose efflux permease
MTAAPPDRHHDSMRAVIAMLCATGLGYWPLYVQPFVVGSLIDSLGFSESRAGLLVTVEFSALALTTLGGAGVIARLKAPVRLAMAAAFLVFLGNLLSASLSEFAWLLPARIVTGLASGISLAIGSTALARVSSPDRKMAFVLVGRGVMGAMMIPLIAAAISAFGHRGSYGFLALVPLVIIPLLSWLPARRGAVARGRALLLDRIGVPVFVLLLGMFLLTLGESVLYSFAERKGVEIGMPLDLIALVITVTTFGGLLGAAIPAALGLRFGRQLPVYASLLAILLAGCVALRADGIGNYSLGLTGFVIGFAVGVPFLFGFSTLLGRTGAVTSALGAMIVGGHTVGPAVAGYVIEAGGFPLLGSFYAWVTASALVCVFLCFSAVSRRRHEFLPEDFEHA